MQSVDSLIQRVAARLSQIPRLEGIVLGGSRARGTHSPDSDVDIGIYYRADTLDLDALNRAARELDDRHRSSLIQPPGAWGPWVNGGAWLTVEGVAVDLLLRDLGRVEQVIRDTDNGDVTANYQVGHPHAFVSATYRGELAVCRVLHSGSARFLDLKARAEEYPSALQKSLTDAFLFEAGFSLTLARKNAGKDDLAYVAAHAARSVFCLCQVLFALNRAYCLNEKKAVRMVAGFARKPENWKERVDRVFASLSASPGETEQGLAELERLIGETAAFVRE